VNFAENQCRKAKRCSSTTATAAHARSRHCNAQHWQHNQTSRWRGQRVTCVWRNRYYSLPPAPAAVPLSDDRILGLFRQAFVACADPMGKNNMTIAFARAIERAHGIGDKT
jgi:hypothetical protein